MRRSPIRRVSKRRAGISAKIKAELDDLARTAVMSRAGAYLVTDEGRKQWWGTCQRCGKVDWLSWCHIFTRAAWSVRWDMDNAWSWCRGCHRWMDQHWESKRDWVIARIGADAFDRLKLRSTGSRMDLAAVRLYLTTTTLRDHPGPTSQ